MIVVLFIVVATIYNLYFISIIPFSGTTYLPLPSNYYVEQNIEDINNSTNIIPSGSFIISINNHNLDEDNLYSDSIKSFDRIVNILKNSPDTLELQIIERHSNYRDELFPKYFFRHFAKKIIISKNSINLDRIRIVVDGIYLGFVDKDGATSKAGIKSGDILLNVNNIRWEVQYYENMNSYLLSPQSLKMLRNSSKDVPLIFKIIRGNSVYSLPVTLSTIGLQLSVVFLFLLQLSFLTIGAFFVFKNTKHLGSLLVGTWLILMSLGMITNYTIFESYNITSQQLLTYLSKILYAVYLPIILVSFAAFPLENPKIIRNVKLIWILFTPSIIYIILITIVRIYNIKLFVNDTLLLVSVTSFCLIYFGVLLIIYRQYEPRENRHASFIQFSVFILIIIINSFGRYKYSDYIQLVFITIPFLYLIYIYKFGINKILFKFKRTTQYSFINIMWYLLLSFSTLSIIFYFSKLTIVLPTITILDSIVQITYGNSATDPNYQYIYRIIFGLFSIVISLIAIRIGSIGQDYLNRKFYRQQFDYRMIQREFAELIQTKYNLNDLSIIIVEKLKEFIHLKKIGIIFYKSQANINQNDVFYYDSSKDNNLSLNLDTKLYDKLKNGIEAISISMIEGQLRNILAAKEYNYIFPLRSKSKLLGVLLIGDKLSEVELRKEDFEFLYSISSNLSMAIENILLYEELAQKERLKHELEIARRIQLGSLPSEIPKIERLDIAAYSSPALEVGGDFYDFYKNNDMFNIVVGDVSGKGTSAALYMSKFQGILRTLNEYEKNPKELLIKSNNLIYKYIESTSYITAVACSFGFVSNHLELVRAGHLPIYKINKIENKLDILKPNGIGIGLANNNIFEKNLDSITIDYNKGDYFVFITDGITDTRNNSGEDYGFNRLENLLINSNYNSANELINIIISSISDFSNGNTQFDDITIVVVKVN